MWLLDERTPEGYNIFYAALMDYDSSKYDMNDQIKLFTVVTDYWLTYYGNSKGFIIVIDNKGATLGHATKFGFNTARKLLAYVQVRVTSLLESPIFDYDFLQEAIPLRLKAIHMINVNSIVEKILMIAKFFMTGETQSMVHKI